MRRDEIPRPGEPRPGDWTSGPWSPVEPHGAEPGRGRRRERSGWFPDGPAEYPPPAEEPDFREPDFREPDFREPDFREPDSRKQASRKRVSEEPDADPESVARAICLRLLTMAPRTRAQLADALRRRAVPEWAAESVLERFSEVGLIDDEAFAAAWVSSRHAGRGLARRALAQELRHRGVDEETVKEAVDQLDPEQEAETARALVRRKLATTRGADPQARIRRLAGMLARKGYSPGLAFRIVREALEAEGVEPEDLPDGPI
ncbi:recombination regulator RecX [Microbispora sp. RL4-1S]|uniref:Regulatory protein RecX n=1 Tax=Microbispora oryzae TaxID=2806554 RepID=A0A941ANH9_9ACTN|nr:recombination regulator RecX [Microbispora oryzae]